jgi:hypothetical protein
MAQHWCQAEIRGNEQAMPYFWLAITFLILLALAVIWRETHQDSWVLSLLAISVALGSLPLLPGASTTSDATTMGVAMVRSAIIVSAFTVQIVASVRRRHHEWPVNEARLESALARKSSPVRRKHPPKRLHGASICTHAQFDLRAAHDWPIIVKRRSGLMARQSLIRF